MANIQISNPDIIQFLGTYERMIENFERTANPLHDIESINYVFYISIFMLFTSSISFRFVSVSKIFENSYKPDIGMCILLRRELKNVI